MRWCIQCIHQHFFMFFPFSNVFRCVAVLVWCGLVRERLSKVVWTSRRVTIFLEKKMLVPILSKKTAELPWHILPCGAADTSLPVISQPTVVDVSDTHGARRTRHLLNRRNHMHGAMSASFKRQCNTIYQQHHRRLCDCRRSNSPLLHSISSSLLVPPQPTPSNRTPRSHTPPFNLTPFTFWSPSVQNLKLFRARRTSPHSLSLPVPQTPSSGWRF